MTLFEQQRQEDKETLDKQKQRSAKHYLNREGKTNKQTKRLKNKLMRHSRIQDPYQLQAQCGSFFLPEPYVKPISESIKPLTFSGETLWTNYRRQFEKVAECNHWNNEQKVSLH